MAIRSLDKKFSCRREAARCFMSLNILLSHSRSLKVIPNNSLEYGACKIKSYFLEGEQVPNIWGPVLLGPTLEPSLSVCLSVCLSASLSATLMRQNLKAHNIRQFILLEVQLMEMTAVNDKRNG